MRQLGWQGKQPWTSLAVRSIKRGSIVTFVHRLDMRPQASTGKYAAAVLKLHIAGQLCCVFPATVLCVPPCSLSLVYMEVAERVGLPMAGVNLPAHFMIRPKVRP